MADEENAAATATAQPVINGFERLTATAPAPIAQPSTGPASSADTQAPAWPREEDLAALPDTALIAGTSVPPAQPDAAPFDAEQFEAARQVLQDALVSEATGSTLDPDQRAGQELDRGRGRPTGLALRVLAAEARARGTDATAMGQALTEAGIGPAAAYLDLVADRMAQAAPFELPDLVGSDVGEDSSATPQAELAPIRTETAAVFDRLSEMRLRAVRADVPEPPAELVAEAFPLEIPQQDLRGPARLARRVQAQRESLENLAEDAPAGVTMALSVAEEVLAAPGLGGDLATRDLARLVVGADTAPLHTAARLRQLADHLTQQLAAAGAPASSLGAYERGWSFTEYLPVVATAIEQVSADPVVRPTARMASLFGRAVITTQSMADTTDAVTERVSAPGPAQESTPYTYDPDLLPEHALLGSLIHAPAVLSDLDFLAPRDFSRSDTRAVYVTLRQLHEDGALFDVAKMPTQAQQLEAANENYRRLFAALRANLSTRDSVSNIPQLIGLMTRAAPPESIPFRGVYEPASQVRMGRMVLEDSIRRQLAGMGVHMQRASSLVAPTQVAPDRAERSAQALVANLETIEAQLASMTKRLISAVVRTGPDGAVAGPTEHAVARAGGRWRLPDRLKVLTEPLLHRAERHILHLALHAGNLDNVPANILALSPEDFSSQKHANTWRVIKHLQQQELPVNYVALHWAAHEQGFAHLPVLSDKDMLRMAEPPEIKPERVARSLRTVVTASLSRARSSSRAAVKDLAAGRDMPVGAALAQVKKEVGGLSDRARTAVERHREITQQQAGIRASSR